LAPRASAATVNIPHRGHYIIESIGDPETVDPAWAYDTSSGELIMNVYEPLISFNREDTGAFVATLATSVPTPQIVTITQTLTDGVDPETGLADADHNQGSGQSITVTYLEKLVFDIRVGVPFHDGVNSLTMEDVEYSFERWLVQDRSGGPTWMINEPVFGLGIYHGDPSDLLLDEIIDSAFRITGPTTFEMRFQAAYAPLLGILAQSWGTIVNKDFMIANGDWPGTWINWSDEAWHDPAEAPVDTAGNVMDGTGPYMMDYWTHGVEFSIVRSADYWANWPFPGTTDYLDRVTEKVVYEWSTRLADFRAGTADSVYVPRQYIEQVRGWPGIRGLPDLPPGNTLPPGEFWGLPALSADGMFFTTAIDPATSYAGSGALDGNGIPLDFFSDIRIRKAFAYLFDWDRFLDEVWLGEAVQPSSPIIEGIPYQIDVPVYGLNLAQAATLFQEASADPTSPAYQVWDKGFYMKITYNTGNQPRQVSTEMLRTNAAMVNSKFRIDTVGVTWSTYLGELWWYPSSRSVMPIYMIGWVADYPDAHNWIFTFMHTYGDFTYPSSYSNPTADALIEEGIATPDGPARAAIYEELQQMYYDEAPSVMMEQAKGRRYERDWVQGYYYNAIAMPEYKYRWEGLNGDVHKPGEAGFGVIDVADAGIINANWYLEGDLGPYHVEYDIAPVLQYQIEKLPPPGDSVGTIDILDLALINAHFGETLG